MTKAMFAVCLFLTFVGSKPATSMKYNVSQDSLVSMQLLRLTGEVTDVNKTSGDVAMVGFKVNLRLTIKNDGKEAIIIYRNNPWLGATDIAGSLDDALSLKYLHRASAWPNTWELSNRLALHKKLDQINPPTDLTLVLKPGESWRYDAIAWVGLDRKTWNEIKNYDSLWLQVTIEMWPVNAEPRLNTNNPQWGKELRERWKSKGTLWLDYLKSEPIKVNFTQ